jgi:hypothetical protein
MIGGGSCIDESKNGAIESVKRMALRREINKIVHENASMLATTHCILRSTER